MNLVFKFDKGFDKGPGEAAVAGREDEWGP
jgi:hypothetical protein